MAFSERSLDDYVDVAQRIADFRELHPTGSLQPADPAKPWEQAVVEGTDKQGKRFAATMIVYTAAAYRTPDDPRPGIGIAWEAFPGRTPYTLGSELMNAETSAWGRAIIAVLASDSKAGVASRQEVKARRGEREDGLPSNRDGSLSRSRTSDDEKDAAGVMTSDQQAEHTALRPKIRETQDSTEHRQACYRWQDHNATPCEACGQTADYPWLDQPAGAIGPTVIEREHEPGSSDSRQRQAVYLALNGRGFTTPDAQRAECTRIAGRLIESRTDLSYAEAVAVLADTGKAATT
jgi:hypothetical protein